MQYVLKCDKINSPVPYRTVNTGLKNVVEWDEMGWRYAVRYVHFEKIKTRTLERFSYRLFVCVFVSVCECL